MKRDFFKLSKIIILLVCLISCKPCFAENISNLTAKGISALQQQDYDAAVGYFSELIQINVADSYLGRGRAYLGKREYHKAISDLNEAILRRPSAVAFHVRGEAYSGIGNYEKSDMDYSEAIKIAPQNGELYFDRAKIRALNHQIELGIIDCNTAILLLGDMPFSNSLLADACCLRGQLYASKLDEKCFIDFKKAIQLSPTDYLIFLSRGKAYTYMKNFSKALQDFNSALILNKTNAVVYANRGVTFAYDGHYDKGISDCKKAIHLDPNCGLAYDGLAWIMGTASDSNIRNGSEALKNAKKACNLTNWSQPQCLDTLAAAYAEIGNYAEAARWEEKCLESDWPEKNLRQSQIRLSLYKQSKGYHEKED